MSIKIKICGITRVEDALAAAKAGVDALGFMFYEPSPRYITPKEALRIITELPPIITKVGVFVNASEEAILQTLSICPLNALQLHGEESPEFCRKFPLPIIKGMRIKDASSLAALPQYSGITWLLDSYVPGKSGGTGERFNWELAVQAKQIGDRIILAGGLTPGNVQEAVQKVQPYGVDVSSGVESAPGKKDHHKVRRFVEAVRNSG